MDYLGIILITLGTIILNFNFEHSDKKKVELSKQKLRFRISVFTLIGAIIIGSGTWILNSSGKTSNDKLEMILTDPKVEFLPNKINYDSYKKNDVDSNIDSISLYTIKLKNLNNYKLKNIKIKYECFLIKIDSINFEPTLFPIENKDKIKNPILIKLIEPNSLHPFNINIKDEILHFRYSNYAKSKNENSDLLFIKLSVIYNREIDNGMYIYYDAYLYMSATLWDLKESTWGSKFGKFSFDKIYKKLEITQ